MNKDIFLKLFSESGSIISRPSSNVELFIYNAKDRNPLFLPHLL